MIRILIADDHAVVRRGLKQIITDEFSEVMFGEAQNAQEVFREVQKQNWNMLILDINLPDRSGLDILGELRLLCPKLPIFVLSIHPEEQYAIRVLKSGASGYMTKESVPEELVKALKKILAGGKYVSSSLAEKLVFALERDIERPLHETLSDREYQVMLMIASGKTVTEISKELNLSVKTISTYRTRILEKMNMKNNAELIHYAIKNRLLD